MPGSAPAASSAGRVARRAWRGLVRVLAGPDTPPEWWHPPWRRRAYLALSLATLALFVLSLASIHTRPTVTPAPPAACRAAPCYYFHYPPLGAGQLLLVMAVVTPLLLAARYPLLGWRIGWLALLLAPPVPAQWREAGPGARRRRSCCWWCSAWPGSVTGGRCCGGCGP